MKKLFFSLLITVFLISCSEPPNSSDLALHKLSKLFNVPKPDVGNDGVLFYMFQAGLLMGMTLFMLILILQTRK